MLSKYLDKIVDINYVVRTEHIISILLPVTLINNVIPYVAYVLLRMPPKRTYFKPKLRKVTRQIITIVCYNNVLIVCNSYIITKEDRLNNAQFYNKNLAIPYVASVLLRTPSERK